MTMFSRFMKDESGATAIEYGLIAALIGVGIIVLPEPAINTFRLQPVSSQGFAGAIAGRRREEWLE